MLIVDTSVALKWVLDEDGSDAAERLTRQQQLGAPDFLLIECANVLWTKARRRQISVAEAQAALAAVHANPLSLFAMADYAVSAQALAFELDQTAYDSLYLAVALAERAVLVTADRAFVDAAARHGVHTHAVRLLGTE